MKSLDTLLKLAQRRMDELGVEAQRLVQHIDGLRMNEGSMLAREELEVAAASRDLSVAPVLAAYRLRVKQHVHEVRTRIAESETTLALIRERLSEAYREKSKFEQLIEQARLRAAMERSTAEQKALDEVAINRVGRV